MPGPNQPPADEPIDEARFWAERQTPDVPDHRLRVRTCSPRELWEDPEVEAIARGRYVDRILEACSSGGLEVLELACGCGWLALEIARCGNQVRGIDLSDGRIASAREYAAQVAAREPVLGRLEYEVADLRDLPLPHARYDRIVCWDGLHHIAPIDPLMDRIFLALKPGGSLLLFDHIGTRSGLQRACDRAIGFLVVLAFQPGDLGRLLKGRRKGNRAPSEDVTGVEMITAAERVFGKANLRAETALGMGKGWLARLRGPRRPRIAGIRLICALDRLAIRVGLLRGEYVLVRAVRTLDAGTHCEEGDSRLPHDDAVDRA